MKVNEFYQKYTLNTDKLVLNVVAALVACGGICILLNTVTFRYSGYHYVSLNWCWLAPLSIGGVLFSALWFKRAPNLAFLLKSYSLYFLAFFAFVVVLDGVQYTPFPTVDNFLAAADQALQIKETALMDWTYAHPLLLDVLRVSYHSVILQWLLMPLLLMLWQGKNQLQFYLTASLLAYLMGAAIYYFFPTVGPAGIFNDPHFNRAQLDTVLNFKEIHRHLMVTTVDGGMIAFPSFHVLWSVISIYALRKAPAAFFAPVLLLNVCAIIATLFLGWNYAVDILCGVLVACIAIYFANKRLRAQALATIAKGCKSISRCGV